MPQPDIIWSDKDFRGNIRFGGTVDFPAGGIVNEDVSSLAAIAASKTIHQRAFVYRQATGTAVVAETAYDWFVVFGATGSLVDLRAAVTGAIATGADRTVTIDLQKSTGGGAFATVLTAPIVLDDASVIRVAEAASGFSSTSLVAGDILRLTVAVAGAAGAQAQGLVVTLNATESPG